MFGTLLFIFALLFLLVMFGSCLVTLAWYRKNGVIGRYNARRPQGTMEIVEGEIVEEQDIPQLGAGS